MARKNRSYQWVGGSQVITPKTDVSSTVGAVFQLAPAISRTVPELGRTECLIEAMYIHISTHRILTTSFDAAGLIVWLANVSEGSANPTQTLDGLSVDPRAYANKNILVLEPLAVPPVLASSDLATVTTSEEVKVHKATFQATRKFDRAQQVLCLQINTDVSDVIRCFVQARVLLSYGSK